MGETPSSQFLLEPGHLVVTPAPLWVGAMVGSCLMVCIWDRRLRFGGAAHFCQPRPRVNQQATAKHGNAACLALIKTMRERGSQARDMIGMLAGGGHPRTGLPGPGQDNILMARHVLQRRWVAVASEDCGGFMGRRVLFHTATGEIAVHKTHEIPESEWHRAETRFHVKPATGTHRFTTNKHRRS